MPSPIPGRDTLDNGSPTFPRSRLPVEILDNILSHVTAYHDMRQILRVSRQFHALMVPKLWKHISVRPHVGGQLLRTLTAQVDAQGSAWRTRGEQVQTLALALEYIARPQEYYDTPTDVRDAYLPVQRFLAGLTNMHTLVLEADTHSEFVCRARWRPSDIGMRKQLAGLRTLVFTPPSIRLKARLHECYTHPNTQFEQWLLSQENIHYFEYRARNRLPGVFPAAAFPNLRRLKIAAVNIEALRGLEGVRGITHLRMTVPPPCPFIIPLIPPPVLASDAPRLPPALSNVTVLARDDRDLAFAGLLPKLERLDIVLKGRNLRRLLAALRAVDGVTGTSRSAHLQGLRFLRVRRLYLTPKDNANEHPHESGGGGAVAEIFAELAALEEFEAMRDDQTWIRFARDGSTRVVEWKCHACYYCSDEYNVCEESGGVREEWCQDWEAGVRSVDPAPPLYFRPVWRMPRWLRSVETSDEDE
ncbi:hypothetical protein PLEOSDRAFT_160865 [Pleurotus ostreatus PC15]|uniref:F-box domain-containing protein n=1 Tax=Pleurotus ostreatus (strain PC15) TaxID=1137138 RepID=A0A067NNC3_PLEO1|nr:hypothetical protein PLEOSDRAFT_160865 [Pleurotus ostreatus PC15]